MKIYMACPLLLRAAITNVLWGTMHGNFEEHKSIYTSPLARPWGAASHLVWPSSKMWLGIRSRTSDRLPTTRTFFYFLRKICARKIHRKFWPSSGWRRTCRYSNRSVFVCLSLRATAFEQNDLWLRYLTLCRSSSTVKVTGQVQGHRGNSQEENTFGYALHARYEARQRQVGWKANLTWKLNKNKVVNACRLERGLFWVSSWLTGLILSTEQVRSYSIFVYYGTKQDCMQTNHTERHAFWLI